MTHIPRKPDTVIKGGRRSERRRGGSRQIFAHICCASETCLYAKHSGAFSKGTHCTVCSEHYARIPPAVCPPLCSQSSRARPIARLIPPLLPSLGRRRGFPRPRRLSPEGIAVVVAHAHNEWLFGVLHFIGLPSLRKGARGRVYGYMQPLFEADKTAKRNGLSSSRISTYLRSGCAVLRSYAEEKKDCFALLSDCRCCEERFIEA